VDPVFVSAGGRRKGQCGDYLVATQEVGRYYRGRVHWLDAVVAICRETQGLQQMSASISCLGGQVKLLQSRLGVAQRLGDSGWFAPFERKQQRLTRLGGPIGGQRGHGGRGFRQTAQSAYDVG
jgi:hypothetical protein